MPELPKNIRTMWLFPDNIVENSDYKFLDFNPEYNSRNNNKIPVFVLWGKIQAEDKKVFEGELLTTIWNIYNYEELKKQLGSNTDKWDKDLFFKLRKEHDKIVMLPVESVK